ncbi:MAG: DUF1801 domain-containing protein [Planctomycetota bacterium]
MPVKSVTDYQNHLKGPRSSIVKKLRSVVRKAAPGATESVKWAQPVFEQDGPFCYIRAHSKHVNLGFFRGAEIRDPDRLLRGTGEMMRHVKVVSLREIDPEAIGHLVRSAVALNKKKGNPIVRK